MAIATHGLTHLRLAVADPERSLRFYERFLGVREYYRDADMIQVLGPGEHDVLAFEKDPKLAGQRGGITHFGFRLRDAAHIESAVREAEGAGGTVLERGEYSPGMPYAYVRDPDGYTIEIWYE